MPLPTNQKQPVTYRRYNNPKLTFYRLPQERTKLYYGIELETGISTKSNKEVEYFLEALPDFVWPKYDGSISDSFKVKFGSDIEIVSHPTTYRWLKANAKAWNKILSLRKSGLLSYLPGSCGMHIHLAKKAFTKSHKRRFITFIFANKGFSHFISQRGPHIEYCSLDLGVDHVNSIINHNDGDKSVAVNCYKPHTIEVRIFRGTLDKIAFWKNIEFCDALYYYTKTHTNPNVKEFLTYISNHNYPNMLKWLKKYKDRLKEVTNARESARG